MAIIRSNGNLIIQTLDPNASVSFVKGNLDSAENNTSVEDWTSGKPCKLDFGKLADTSEQAAQASQKVAEKIVSDYSTPAPDIESAPSTLDNSTQAMLTFKIPAGVNPDKIANVNIKATHGKIENYSIDKVNKVIKVIYLAPAYDSSDNDSTDNIDVSVAEAGKLFSPPTTTTVKINKVEFKYDQSIQVSGSEFETYSYKSKGLKWQ